MNPPNVWASPDNRTLYVQWHDADTFQVITEDGPDGERWTLPADVRPLTRHAPQTVGWTG